MTATAGKASAWWNGDWSYRKQITIDAAAAGAALPGDPGRIAVLVRLHDGNFKFSAAKEDGTDIRFVGSDDKTPLKFHLEKYDAVFDVATIWVDIPDLKAGQPTNIFMYFGNAKAPAGDDAHGTYGPGQVLVYHFGEKGQPPRDSTVYGNNATAPAATIDSALIGAGIRFDGSSFITLPSSTSLAVPAGGALTWSAWIKPGDSGVNEILYAHRDGGAALVIGVAQGKPYAAVAGGAGAPVRLDAAAAIPAGSWHHIALSAAGPQVTLYVDGQQVATAAVSLPALVGGGSVGGDAVAAQPLPDGTPAATGFIGDFDELEIANIGRSASFIRAQYANQSTDAKLLRYGGDEENSTWASGYFVIILRSVTIDGWVIIGVLAMMAVASWLIMVNRARHISAVGRTNGAFLKAYRQVRGDLLGFEHKVNHTGPDGFPPQLQALIRQSPLHRLFLSGIEELRDRIAGDRGTVLSSQAIQAIRAAVDATYVREHQSINRMLVLLTIAISGGPFIGLLGTVVGVMITFASIAASGDVNINAIAPGISAALVATVAGLVVAIPALFGYNYLLSRVKEETAAMQVFIDMFIARIAELYDTPAKLRSIVEE